MALHIHLVSRCRVRVRVRFCVCVSYLGKVERVFKVARLSAHLDRRLDLEFEVRPRLHRATASAFQLRYTHDHHPHLDELVELLHILEFGVAVEQQRRVIRVGQALLVQRLCINTRTCTLPVSTSD